jgi:hypothetical protein
LIQIIITDKTQNKEIVNVSYCSKACAIGDFVIEDYIQEEIKIKNYNTSSNREESSDY